jgi:DNA-damage-inducible protein D
MKKEIIKQLYSAFERAALEIDGVECWSARELQALLGYSKWENFANVINKAKLACEGVGNNVSDHFPDVRKTIAMPKSAETIVAGTDSWV